MIDSSSFAFELLQLAQIINKDRNSKVIFMNFSRLFLFIKNI